MPAVICYGSVDDLGPPSSSSRKKKNGVSILATTTTTTLEETPLLFRSNSKRDHHPPRLNLYKTPLSSCRPRSLPLASPPWSRFIFPQGLVQYPLEVRMQNFTVVVPMDDPDEHKKIRTVYNSSLLYPIVNGLHRLYKGEPVIRRSTSSSSLFSTSASMEDADSAAGSSSTTTKTILENVNLVLEPGLSYLLLGPPGVGKTTLLKAIAGRLGNSNKKDKRLKCSGSISYNGRTLEESFYIQNCFSYIDQLDIHAPRLTVKETFEFAHKCKSPAEPEYEDDDNDDEHDCGEAVIGPQELFGGNDEETDDDDEWDDTPDVHDRKREKLRGRRRRRRRKHSTDTSIHSAVNLILAGLDLTHVKDTFVGDVHGATVRGVSGGQRRRVTVGEMLAHRVSVLCGDEISTGLDAASTYDMVQVLLYFDKLCKLTSVISLLQPSPETVSLFDQVILLAGEGQTIYAGPVDEVEAYFGALGYVCPPTLDSADFLQHLSTGAASFLYHPERASITRANMTTPPTIYELAHLFRQSRHGEAIQERLLAPHKYLWKQGDSVHRSSTVSRISSSHHVHRKYANSFFLSTELVLRRFLTLWVRDKRVILASAAKNIIMGLSVGGVYLSTDDTVSIEGALFQAGLFIMLGATQSANALVTDRLIFYKHTDANFYSAWPFVFGRAMSQIPQTTFDTILFSTILYYMVGLAGRDDPGNFFIYLVLLLLFALLMSAQLAVFASFANASTLNAYSAPLVLLLILFSGFIVSPATIPDYLSWLYWWNPFAWIYRALVVSEFRSDRWPYPDKILLNNGFVDSNGKPFGAEWIAYAFTYTLPYSILCTILTALGLTFVRNEGGKAAGEPNYSEEEVNNATNVPPKTMQIAFKPVTVSFRDICYDVPASTGNETLRLLSNVSGVFRPGRMCALMGSSGSGKTTLLDVISLRKRSGTIKGTVLLNGWSQEKIYFRRCSGYVEQHDVQSPELTVRETILFSARLRLDPELVPNDEETQAFVDQIMEHVELSSLRDTLVGTDEDFGLSFEQKKRLSIAVELAASPSILFLDEPTSGLDARNALLVVQTLRRTADTGRTICATIHQPSYAVFKMFDDLLLLKKGGQVVFHGDIGKENCSHLVSYFEARGAESIALGTNPANWMLRVVDSGDLDDLAESYVQSDEYRSLRRELDELESTRQSNSKIEFEREFATSVWKRHEEVNRRLRTIYWRSPTYNYARLVLSLVIAAVLGSAFISNRNPEVFSESDMRSRVSVVFLSFIIVGIMAMLSVLPVMRKIRDMYYRHRYAGMYSSLSMGIALGVVEKWFIVLSTVFFTTVFLATPGFIATGEPIHRRVLRCISFWGFFTFNFAIYSYFGQLFVCLVKPLATSIILSSVFIGLNNFFSGLIVRPQFLVGTFYEIPYLICPGHYVYDGLLQALYQDNQATVLADSESLFELWLLDSGSCTLIEQGNCTGTADEFVQYSFGGELGGSGPGRSAIVLGCILLLARVLTWVALKFIRFS